MQALGVSASLDFSDLPAKHGQAVKQGAACREHANTRQGMPATRLQEFRGVKFLAGRAGHAECLYLHACIATNINKDMLGLPALFALKVLTCNRC